MADEQGRIIDGDQILALIARSWAKNGLLKGGGVVGTVMSNAGLDRYLQGQGLKLARAQVGDRYVIAEMKKGGFNVGGEQSGTSCSPISQRPETDWSRRCRSLRCWRWKTSRRARPRISTNRCRR